MTGAAGGSSGVAADEEWCRARSAGGGDPGTAGEGGVSMAMSGRRARKRGGERSGGRSGGRSGLQAAGGFTGAVRGVQGGRKAGRERRNRARSRVIARTELSVGTRCGAMTRSSFVVCTVSYVPNSRVFETVQGWRKRIACVYARWSPPPTKAEGDSEGQGRWRWECLEPSQHKKITMMMIIIHNTNTST